MLYPEPDYENYSLSSLLEAQRNIDRQLYPERALKIDQMIEQRKAAGFVARPEEKTTVPTGAWLVLIYCVFGALSSCLIFSLSATIDPASLPAEYAGKNPILPFYLLLPTFARSLVALMAASLLVKGRRLAVKLFLVAAILAFAMMPIAALIGSDAFTKLSGALAAVFNSALMAAFWVYARHLEKKGILKS